MMKMNNHGFREAGIWLAIIMPERRPMRCAGTANH